MRKYPLFPGLISLLICALATAQTEHNTGYTGTWKLNVSKSVFKPGNAPQSMTLKFTPEGKTIVSGIDQRGKPFEWAIPWSDGKEVRIEGLENTTGTQIIRGHSLKATLKEGGRTVLMIEANLAPDGKTQLGIITNIDEKGHRTQHTEFYEKQ